jgi:hypothetical protein
MSTKSLAKSHDEFLWELMDSYRDQVGGGYRMEGCSYDMMLCRLGQEALLRDTFPEVLPTTGG